MDDFALDPQLAADTVEIARWDLCRILLMKDANYPWLILVPERAGLRDLHDLSDADLMQATAETARASRILSSLVQPTKMNVAMLGNQVPQLHIHVIARSTDDPAWPKPVWGVKPARPYAAEALSARVAELRAAMGPR